MTDIILRTDSLSYFYIEINLFRKDIKARLKIEDLYRLISDANKCVIRLIYNKFNFNKQLISLTQCIK